MEEMVKRNIFEKIGMKFGKHAHGEFEHGSQIFELAYKFEFDK